MALESAQLSNAMDEELQARLSLDNGVSQSPCICKSCNRCKLRRWVKRGMGVVKSFFFPCPAAIHYDDVEVWTRHMRIMPAEKLAEFGTFSGKFHACLVCG